MLIIRKLLIFSIVYVGFELLDIMERLANHYVATECEFDVRKVLKKLWEWNIFSNFIGDNQRVTNKYPFP